MTLQWKEKIVYDKRGRKKEVIIPYTAYRKLLALLEDLDDLNAMKEVEFEETVSWEQVKDELRQQGKL